MSLQLLHPPLRIPITLASPIPVSRMCGREQPVEVVKHCVNTQSDKPFPCNSLVCVREAAPHQKMSWEPRDAVRQLETPKNMWSKPGESSQIHPAALITRQVHSRSRIPVGIQDHGSGSQHVHHISQARIKSSVKTALREDGETPTESDLRLHSYTGSELAWSTSS